MNSYESMIVLVPELSDSEYTKVIDSIKEKIAALDGEVVETVTWGKRTLSYEIQKKKEGYYLINYFSLDPAEVKELERFYQLNENILRYNVLRINED
ncbi:MAG: 30S ribosomal protein S6 [Candidatus Cloacimonadia bacterium]|jgi:small subunit ribosomal protein S6